MFKIPRILYPGISLRLKNGRSIFLYNYLLFWPVLESAENTAEWGLGAGGGLGVAILVLGFGLKPSSPSITAMLIIICVISAVSILQAVGGLDYLVRVAERILRKKPQAITFVAPILTSVFTLFCGTTYVAFSLYPVIAEVAAEAKVRPERALSATVIAASVAVAASPMSAATAGMLAILHEYAGITLGQILSIALPSFFYGCNCYQLFSLQAW